MTAEKDKMRCCDCKYFQPFGRGFEGICEKGHGVLQQKEGGLPLGYIHFNKRSCWEGVFGPTTEERVARLEARLDYLERTERVGRPTKSEFLLDIFKVIAETYTAGEIDEAIQLLRDEISKAADHYHDLPKEGDKMGTSE